MAELSARLGERLMRDSGEVAAHIAARWGVVYGPSGCVALLHRLGFEYKRPESLPARSDEARQAAFISRYDQLLNGLAADEVADAVHPEYQSRPAPGSARATRWRCEGHRGASASTSTRRSTWRPLVEAERIERATRLEASNPGARHRPTPVINARVVRQWLERPDCRITLVFLPAYAPHLNAIERLWAVMHREVTHNRFHPNFGHFVDAASISFADDCHKSGGIPRDHIPQGFSGSGVSWV